MDGQMRMTWPAMVAYTFRCSVPRCRAHEITGYMAEAGEILPHTSAPMGWTRMERDGVVMIYCTRHTVRVDD